jgi:hypothetical protein
METQKVQLLHPLGKKAFSISMDKYALLKTEMLNYLEVNGQGTFSGMCAAIDQNLKNRKVTFDGSLKWYLEWVKLDLESRKWIIRVPKTSPQQYKLANS